MFFRIKYITLVWFLQLFCNMNKVVVAAAVHTLTPHDVLKRFDFFKDATGKYHTVLKCALESTLSTKNMDNICFQIHTYFEFHFICQNYSK